MITIMSLKGPDHHSWKGGLPKCGVCQKELVSRYAKTCLEHRVKKEKNRKYSHGYILIYKPDHPFHNSQGYVKEHRFVIEQKIGRYLTKKEYVHHINHIKDDNRIENLMIIDPGSHSRLHNLGNKHWVGRHHTEGTKEKMRLSATKRGSDHYNKAWRTRREND